MYSKIAIGNVRKSFKDYSIYFLTITLAVCIFYSFNSIESQKALVEMSKGEQDYAKTLTDMISYVSVFISIILGSLMLYANNFLIKKRNKELGIYMTLGMSKNKISKILIMETLIVGLLSLVSGLILGLLTSQGLSILVSKLFEVSMTEYNFVISYSAIGKTILYFGIMFLLVMIFNTYVISKHKIIDLLTVGRKNQDIKFKNPIVYLITFITSVIALGIAYKLILDTGLNYEVSEFWISIILGVLGTIIFFFSLAGFILYIAKNNKKVYFKNLNIFIVKQINSKVNTNFLSMSVICLMLFITISVLTTGMSFKQSLESGLKYSTPYDVSVNMYIQPEDKVQNIEESLNNIGFKFDKNDKYTSYDEYMAGVKIKDLIPIDKKDPYANIDVNFIKISEYNNLKELKGENRIKLNDDEILILSNFSKIKPHIDNYLEKNNTLKIKDKDYIVKNKKAIEENLYTYVTTNTLFTVVINDGFCNEAVKASSILNVNYLGKDNESSEVKYRKLNDEYKSSDKDYESRGFAITATKQQVYEESKGMTTTILFIGMYLGIIFLISSMAVLSLQQLSEASDSIDRYISLKKLGVNEKSINKTIFTQTLIYFSLPISLAILHSIIGIQVANDFISVYNKPNITSSSFITTILFMIIYGVYFYSTYIGYKSIVKNKMK